MRGLLLFIIGAILGAWGYSVYQHRHAGFGYGPAPSVGTAARESASGLREGIESKLEQWRLKPDDIRADLARSGQVVRSTGREVGARIADARIVAVIKAKYVLDRNLSAWDIGVHCQDGEVTLEGTVPSAELLGHAVALAMDTDGVRTVTARIRIQAEGSS